MTSHSSYRLYQSEPTSISTSENITSLVEQLFWIASAPASQGESHNLLTSTIHQHLGTSVNESFRGLDVSSSPQCQHILAPPPDAGYVNHNVGQVLTEFGRIDPSCMSLTTILRTRATISGPSTPSLIDYAMRIYIRSLSPQFTSVSTNVMYSMSRRQRRLIDTTLRLDGAFRHWCKSLKCIVINNFDARSKIHMVIQSLANPIYFHDVEFLVAIIPPNPAKHLPIGITSRLLPAPVPTDPYKTAQNGRYRLALPEPMRRAQLTAASTHTPNLSQPPSLTPMEIPSNGHIGTNHGSRTRGIGPDNHTYGSALTQVPHAILPRPTTTSHYPPTPTPPQPATTGRTTTIQQPHTLQEPSPYGNLVHNSSFGPYYSQSRPHPTPMLKPSPYSHHLRTAEINSTRQQTSFLSNHTPGLTQPNQNGHQNPLPSQPHSRPAPLTTGAQNQSLTAMHHKHQGGVKMDQIHDAWGRTESTQSLTPQDGWGRMDSNDSGAFPPGSEYSRHQSQPPYQTHHQGENQSGLELFHDRRSFYEEGGDSDENGQQERNGSRMANYGRNYHNPPHPRSNYNQTLDHNTSSYNPYGDRESTQRNDSRQQLRQFNRHDSFTNNHYHADSFQSNQFSSPSQQQSDQIYNHHGPLGQQQQQASSLRQGQLDRDGSFIDFRQQFDFPPRESFTRQDNLPLRQPGKIQRQHESFSGRLGQNTNGLPPCDTFSSSFSKPRDCDGGNGGDNFPSREMFQREASWSKANGDFPPRESFKRVESLDQQRYTLNRMGSFGGYGRDTDNSGQLMDEIQSFRQAQNGPILGQNDTNTYPQMNDPQSRNSFQSAGTYGQPMQPSAPSGFYNSSNKIHHYTNDNNSCHSFQSFPLAKNNIHALPFNLQTSLQSQQSFPFDIHEENQNVHEDEDDNGHNNGHNNGQNEDPYSFYAQNVNNNNKNNFTNNTHTDQYGNPQQHHQNQQQHSTPFHHPSKPSRPTPLSNVPFAPNNGHQFIPHSTRFGSMNLNSRPITRTAYHSPMPLKQSHPYPSLNNNHNNAMAHLKTPGTGSAYLDLLHRAESGNSIDTLRALKVIDASTTDGAPSTLNDSVSPRSNSTFRCNSRYGVQLGNLSLSSDEIGQRKSLTEMPWPPAPGQFLRDTFPETTSTSNLTTITGQQSSLNNAVLIDTPHATQSQFQLPPPPPRSITTTIIDPGLESFGIDELYSIDILNTPLMWGSPFCIPRDGAMVVFNAPLLVYAVVYGYYHLVDLVCNFAPSQPNFFARFSCEYAFALPRRNFNVIMLAVLHDNEKQIDIPLMKNERLAKNPSPLGPKGYVSAKLMVEILLDAYIDSLIYGEDDVHFSRDLGFLDRFVGDPASRLVCQKEDPTLFGKTLPSSNDNNDPHEHHFPHHNHPDDDDNAQNHGPPSEWLSHYAPPRAPRHRGGVQNDSDNESGDDR